MGGRADRREKAVRSALGHAPVAPDGRRCIVLCTNLHRPSPAARAGPRAYWRSVVSERYAAHELSSELSLKAKKRLQDQHRDRIVPFSQSSCATWDKSFTPCLEALFATLHVSVKLVLLAHLVNYAFL